LRWEQIRDSADPVRILHITDPHLFADRAESLRGAVTFDTLQRVLAHYRNSEFVADLVALTGDIVQDDSAEAYSYCRELVSSLGLPVSCVPGNHDVRHMMRDVLSEPPFSYCGSFAAGNWLIIGIDSCSAGRAGGRIAQRELRRMEEAITAASAEHVLICLHHPPVPMRSKWLDSVGLDNGEEFLARAASAGRVRAAIFGHVHQDYDAAHGGIRLLATPSTCRQFLPRADEFAVDDKPPAYRRIELRPDGSMNAELIWVASD
jgi:Icc protein